jgi:hypothetical protein
VVDEGRRGGKPWPEKRRRETVGVAVGSGHDLEWSVQSERGWSVVRTGRLTGGPSGFDIFLELSKPTQTWKLKMDALCAPKIPKVFTLLDWGIMNNFLNCADIQISIDVELEFLEQIHNLNFW